MWPHYTGLAAWAMRLGISVTHCRPYHPQTQGKEERFHRTLNEEVLAFAAGGAAFADLAVCQRAFDDWRSVYNEVRPHDALGLAVPADRYRVSERSFPAHLPSAEYDEAVEVRSVDTEGRISFLGRRFRVGKAFAKSRVGLVPAERDGTWQVYYCHQRVWLVDLGGARRPSRSLMRHPCLRTGVTHLPCPYTRWGGTATRRASTGSCATKLLSQELFGSLAEARVLAERFRWHYNEARPHSALGYLSLAAFASTLTPEPATALS